MTYDLDQARNAVRRAVGIAARAADTTGREKTAIEAELEQARTALLTSGYRAFERDRTLSPDPGDGTIAIPAGEHLVQACSADAVVENGKLYDRSNQTLVWTTDVKVTTRLDTPFIEMEQVYQSTVIAGAALGYWRVWVRGNAPRSGRDRTDAAEIRLLGDLERAQLDARAHDGRNDPTDLRDAPHALRMTGRASGGGRWR